MSPRFPEAATSERGGVPGGRDRERDFPKLHRMALTTTQVEISREPEAVRHLCESSNFLSPRIGFFKSEMWNAIMAEARTAISITSRSSTTAPDSISALTISGPSSSNLRVNQIILASPSEKMEQAKPPAFRERCGEMSNAMSVGGQEEQTSLDPCSRVPLNEETLWTTCWNSPGIQTFWKQSNSSR